jgi:hypothetical protein
MLLRLPIRYFSVQPRKFLPLCFELLQYAVTTLGRCFKIRR